MLRSPFLVAAFATVGLVFSSVSHAQNMGRYAIEPWFERDFVQTYDHPLIQSDGHVNGAPSDTSVFFWDSFGRVRTSRDDANAPWVGYRILTIDLGTDSRYVRSTMDEFDAAVGLHLGETPGRKNSTVLGAGYSSTHPFTHSSGIFGIGHLLAEKQIDDHQGLVLSVDYEGNSSFLPDVPLPGFAYVWQSPKVQAYVGYPQSKAIWKPSPKWEVSAGYTVPYTADVDVEYRAWEHVGFYANAGNFCQGVVTASRDGVPEGDITNRQFYQFKRIESGVRFIFDPWVDAAVSVGYAFDQTVSTGFDVRDMQGFAQLSNQPYIAFVIRGRF